MFKLSLCQTNCCPTVEVVDGQFVIRDDFGGNVVLTPEQLDILVDKYPVLKQELP